jgi:hypothetical protein
VPGAEKAENRGKGNGNGCSEKGIAQSPHVGKPTEKGWRDGISQSVYEKYVYSEGHGTAVMGTTLTITVERPVLKNRKNSAKTRPSGNRQGIGGNRINREGYR